MMKLNNRLSRVEVAIQARFSAYAYGPEQEAATHALGMSLLNYDGRWDELSQVEKELRKKEVRTELESKLGWR